MKRFFKSKRVPATEGEAAELEFNNKYDVTDVILGKGSFAQVKKGFNKKTKEKVAIKIMNKKEMTAEDLKSLQKEIQILQKVNHRNIVRLYDSYQTENEVIIVMEFIGGGELYKRIVKAKTAFSEDDIRKIVFQVASALKHCQERGIAHRDLKPQNILYTSEEEGSNLKLVDFNLGFNADPESMSFRIMQTQCGTPNYVAPEVLTGHNYGSNCDVWSLGIITFVVASGGYMPFSDPDTQVLLRMILKGKWEFAPESAWENISQDLKDLIKRMLTRNPDKRINLDGILGHRWMKKAHLEETKIDVSNFEKNLQRKFKGTLNVVNAAAVFGELMAPESVKDFESLTNFQNI